MELYVLSLLGAAGYLLSKDNTKSKVVDIKVKKGELPSGDNIYNSSHTENVQNKIKKKTAKMVKASKNSKKTGVIPLNKEQIGELDRNPEKIKSSLAGVEIPIEDFKTENMVPYFGGNIKQNMNDRANNVILQNFTGVGDDYIPKQELKSFGDLNRNTTNVTGAPAITDFEQSRYVASSQKNNVLPFKQVKVAPGLNQNYGAEGVGGFQQDIRQFELDRGVDELRTANNPKITYDAVTLDGQKGSMRGLIGDVNKNRVDTFYEQTPDKFLTTTGAYVKDAKRPAHVVKDTTRQETTTEYGGSAYQNAGEFQRGEIALTNTQQLGEYGMRNADARYLGKGDNYDYGKDNIMVYTNERDITTTRTYEGNLTTLIKSITAPIQDLLKFSKKEYDVQNARDIVGPNFQRQAPSKATIYDPDDTLRTTVNETTIGEVSRLNLRGNNKGIAYDEDDVARTTTKETLLQELDNGNLKGNIKQIIWDPNDVARTTLKETTIHDNDYLNLATIEKRSVVYDPDEITKITLRNTLANIDNNMNVRGKVPKATVYDPDDKLRTTTKETLTDHERFGNIEAREREDAGYTLLNHEAKNTNRQLSSGEYMGDVFVPENNAYLNEDYDMRNTSRQFQTDEYFNPAISANKKDTDHTYINNAVINSTKELLEEDRVPVAQGPKTNVSGNMVNQDVNSKKTLPEGNFSIVDKIYDQVGDKEFEYNFTKEKKEYNWEDRLDAHLLDALKTNPYAINYN